MMRRRHVLVFLAGAAAVWGAGPLVAPGTAGGSAVAAARGAAVRAGAVRTAGSWGRAVEVPGLGDLNKGGQAKVASVSCGSPGYCTAGGYYQDQRRRYQGFVVVERHGRWRRAVEVPGLGGLNKGGDAGVNEVSCTSARNCTVGGEYRDQRRNYQGFVASERHGRWGRAIEVPGLGALNKGGNADVNSVSCTSAGNCAAGGDYQDQHLKSQGFLAVERHGRWGRAIEVPALEALDMGRSADVNEVSCASAGSCAAGGDYWNHGHDQGFVVSEKNGVWGQAVEVPGLGALNAGGAAKILSVSCGSAGNCAAGGSYTDGDDNVQGFVASEKNGMWGQAIEVPGLETLNDSGDAAVSSMSCTSAGDCLAGGSYYYGYDWGYVVSEKNGVWGRATNVPGLGAIVTGRSVDVWSLSCASPGNCAVGGTYEDLTSAGSLLQGFVVSERNGRWDKAIEMPGPRTLNKGGEAIALSVSCGSAGSCAAGGYYTDRHGHNQGFVT